MLMMLPSSCSGPKMKKGVNEQRKELADGDGARVNQVQHQEHDARAQEIHRGALNEAEAPHVANLLQLQLQDLAGRAVEAVDFLLGETEALHELDVAERFGRGSGQRGRFSDDRFLNLLDAPAQDR